MPLSEISVQQAYDQLPAGLKIIAAVAILLGGGFVAAVTLRDRWAAKIKAEVTVETDAKIKKLEERMTELEHAVTSARALNVQAVACVAKLSEPEADKAAELLQRQAAVLG